MKMWAENLGLQT